MKRKFILWIIKYLRKELVMKQKYQLASYTLDIQKVFK